MTNDGDGHNDDDDTIFQNSPVSHHLVVAVNCCGAPAHNDQQHGHKQKKVFTFSERKYFFPDQGVGESE